MAFMGAWKGRRADLSRTCLPVVAWLLGGAGRWLRCGFSTLEAHSNNQPAFRFGGRVGAVGFAGGPVGQCLGVVQGALALGHDVLDGGAPVKDDEAVEKLGFVTQGALDEGENGLGVVVGIERVFRHCAHILGRG